VRPAGAVPSMMALMIRGDTKASGARWRICRSAFPSCRAMSAKLWPRGDLDLKIIPCSCRPGTEGTMACNYGRSCGVLTVEVEDVGDILMPENLAHPYECGRYSCPTRQPWCPFQVPEGEP
jgi:hypothetical protein